MIDGETDLPEGTDSVIAGASGPAETVAETVTPNEKGNGAKSTFAGARESIRAEAEGLRGQAGDTVRAYALQGKERTTDAIDGIVKLVNDAADTVESKVGAQYAGYARDAAGSLAGIADTLREKDVDDLVEDAKTFVRNSPGIAIGAAAAAGFLLARVFKASTPAETDDSKA